MKTAKTTSAKKPAAKTSVKTAVKKVVKKVAAKKPAAKTAPAKKAAPKKAVVSPEDRYRMVQEAAYFIAEKHGFSGDNSHFWWLAEIEVSKQFD